ncbi:MAG: dehydro coenzyme reductase / coenzyme F420-0:L-glutamate ligase / coenzyme [Nocardioidaceae bacterium]|nr:dehydro coenzyme reductase / coenzyme F420-0:L-glutamate ligase / coenzyme [Nocardioidaceae bacterium]
MTPDDDLGEIIVAREPNLSPGDIVVVTSKVMSKAEGRVVAGVDRDEILDSEAVRLVGRRGPIRIVETRHGFMMAAAGVDARNTDPGTLVLLPRDPDRSAQRIRKQIRDLSSVEVAVVISDTFGRPWRTGLVDMAVGAAGLDALEDLRGCTDPWGTTLDTTVTAVGDEIAAAANLVKGKLAQMPVAVIRGLGRLVTAADSPGAQRLVRVPEEDMFRLGSNKAAAAALAVCRTVRDFRPDAVDLDIVRISVADEMTAPAPHDTTPWRFVVVADPRRRVQLLDAMHDEWTVDPEVDGFSHEQVRRRTRRREVLRKALLVALGRPEVARRGSDASDRHGCGGRELLGVLGPARLGSAWLSSTLFCRPVVRQVRLPSNWDPMSTVAIGHAAAPASPRLVRDPNDCLASADPLSRQASRLPFDVRSAARHAGRCRAHRLVCR